MRFPKRDIERGDLVIRCWRMEDAPELHAAIEESIEHLLPWMPWIEDEPMSVVDRAHKIKGWISLWDAGGDSLVAIMNGDRVVGGAGLHDRVGEHGLEIGYWIRAGHTGKGYATETARALTTLGFTDDRIDRIEIRLDEANGASRRVPEKLGYDLVDVRPGTVESPGECGIDLTFRMVRGNWHDEPLWD